MNQRIRVVVAEAADRQRGMLRFVLEEEGFDVLAETRGVDELISSADAEQPDAVVIEEDLGIDPVSAIRAMCPLAKIVIVGQERTAVSAVVADAFVERTHVMK